MQISECISGGLDYFITTDKNLLDHETELFEKYKIEVLSPTEFILNVDKLVNNINYNSTRLAGANYNYRNPNAEEIDDIIESFLNCSKGEKKSELRNCLTKYIGDVEYSIIKIVQDTQGYKGIWLGKQTDVSIDIKLIRTSQDKLSSPLFNQLLNNIIGLCISREKREILIGEKYLNQDELSILEHYGFNETPNGWHKFVFNTITNTEKLLDVTHNDLELEHLRKIYLKLNSTSSQELVHLVERKLWPLKFDNLEIPTYIVPIKPYWASQLFDHIAANSMIFGSQPQLVWNRENIYYRSVNPVSEKAPSRILWYASSSKTVNSRSKSIVASSYLDGVLIDEAKKLFSRHKAYGIYKWSDIRKLAKEDIKHPIKALRFSDTEVFKKPVRLKRINEILIDNGRKENTFPSPLEVSNKIFIEIYKEGKNE